MAHIEMDKIVQSIVPLASGKELNVAIVPPPDDVEAKGQAIVFLHGFPGTCYSWRHQLKHLSELGYQAIAPDLRGYGGSTAPEGWSSYSTVQIVGDLVELLDALGLGKVFLVGHDIGAIVAWHFCLLRPDRVTAMVNTSVAFMFREPSVEPMPAYENAYGADFYMCRFQDPETADAQLKACPDAQNVVRGFYDFFGGKAAPILKKGEGFDDKFGHEKIPKPAFLTVQDVKTYADTFTKTGYTAALSHFRAINQTWDLMAAFKGLQITTPVKFVVGELDFAYCLNGVKDYIKNDLPGLVPNLEVQVVTGKAHFLHEEDPTATSDLIYQYFDGKN